MSRLPKLLLGALGLAAVAGIAAAAARDVRVLNVVLPDGSVEHIRYIGNVAPRVLIAPGGAAAMPAGFLGADDPFAAMERTMAAMEAQTDAMLRQAALLSSRQDAGVPGTTSYSYTSFTSGGAAGCMQSVQVTSFAPGQAPKVVRRSSGDCRAMSVTRATPTTQTPDEGRPAPAPAATVRPAIVPVRYQAPPAPPSGKAI